MTAKVQSITTVSAKTEQPETDREAEQKEIESRKREAKFHWAKVLNGSVMASKNSLSLGFHAHILKQKNLWGILGYKDEHEARMGADVGESTWYSTIRLAEQFAGADETLFISMKLSNAKALADLPESKRQDKQWLKWAAEDKIADFQKRCDEAMFGKAKPSDTKEQIRQMKMTVPVSRQKVIEQKVKEYAVAVGLNPADTGKVIEVAMTEVTGGKSLMEAITGSMAKFKEAKEYVHSGVSVDEGFKMLERVMDEVILDFSQALDQAKQRSTEAA